MNTLQSTTAISVNMLALVLLTKSLESNLSRASICSLPPSPGYGDCNNDHEEHFYFDKYELRCKKFLFMNCHGGNENRFVTEAQCNRFCQGSACAAGEAVAVTPEGVPLICHKPSICPQGYKCVYNKLFNRHHCCGFPNNGGVCPVDSVSYTSLATGAALRCIPSARSDSCPEGFICVGKGQSGYCCRPNDICPLGQIAEERLPSAHSVKCNLQEVNNDCSERFECISPYHAPWGFCCSSNVTGWCPNDSRPFLSPDNGQPQKCTVGVTVCRVGYSCQSRNNSIIGFCCSDPPDSGYKLLETELEEPYWLQNLSIADEISSAVESRQCSWKDSNKVAFSTNISPVVRELTRRGTNQPTNIPPMRSVVFDLMTVLTCPDALSPSYLTNSQLIIECTETEQSTTTCPAPARCVRAPRDVLRRSVCCSGFNGS